MAKIVLRQDGLAHLRAQNPDLRTDAALAQHIGMDPGHVSRILHGAPIGELFIANLLQLFGAEHFQDLFAVVTFDTSGDA
jgi:hypothetical protein